MCTAATYCNGDFYFGRNLDYEFSYGEHVTIMSCNIIRGGVPPVKRAAAVSADTRAIRKKAPFRVLFCLFVPAHAPSFASMASQTSSMSPTMP